MALDVGSVSVAAGFSVTGGGSTAATVDAVFFAAIVFAGFLAALRAAGLVPAAFFFAGAFFADTFLAGAFLAATFFAPALRAVTFFAVARLAIVRVRLPADLFLAAALRIGRLARIVLRAGARLAADVLAMLRAPERRFAAALGAVLRLAVLAVERFAVLRTDRFTDFLAADCFFAAMLASAREEIASVSASPTRTTRATGLM